MKVIAISGKKRSGKDYSKNLLLSKLNNSVSIAFADCLKKSIVSLFGNVDLYDESVKTSYIKDLFALRSIENNRILDIGRRDKFAENEETSKKSKTKITPLTYVELMQYLGSKWKKDFGDEVFIVRTIKELESHNISDDSIIIISDLRLKVEYNYLKNRFHDDLITLRINSTQSPESTDISEVDLDEHIFDFSIDNSSRDENKLNEKLDKFLYDFGLICASNNN